MKTKFELESYASVSGVIQIIGSKPKHGPYVSITVRGNKDKTTIASLFIKDKELERFAVNILKALKSEKLST